MITIMINKSSIENYKIHEPVPSSKYHTRLRHPVVLSSRVMTALLWRRPRWWRSSASTFTLLLSPMMTRSLRLSKCTCYRTINMASRITFVPSCFSFSEDETNRDNFPLAKRSAAALSIARNFARDSSSAGRGRRQQLHFTLSACRKGPIRRWRSSRIKSREAASTEMLAEGTRRPMPSPFRTGVPVCVSVHSFVAVE